MKSGNTEQNSKPQCSEVGLKMSVGLVTWHVRPLGLHSGFKKCELFFQQFQWDHLLSSLCSLCPAVPLLLFVFFCFLYSSSEEQLSSYREYP